MADQTDKNLVSLSFHHSSLIHPEHSGCNVHYPVNKSQLLDSLLSHLNPMHTLTHNVSYVFNIILHISLGFPNDSFPCFFFSINALYGFLNSKKCYLVWFRHFRKRKQQKCTNIWLTSRKSNTVEYNSEYSAKALPDVLWCFIAFYHATLGIRTRPICRVREGTAGYHFVFESFWHVGMIS